MLDARARRLHQVPCTQNQGTTVKRCQEIMMLTSQRLAVGLSVIAAGLLAACSSSTEAPQPANIAVVSGSGQTGFAGLPLTQALVVKVTDANDNPLANQIVDFAVTAGAGTLNPATDTTDATGTAVTQLTPASTATSVQVTATVRSTALSAIFTETVQQSSASITCTSSNTVTLALGEVRTALSGTGVCLQGSSTGGGFLVHAFFASTVATAQTSIGITGFGITPAPPTANRVSGTSPALASLSPTGLSLSAERDDPAGDISVRLRALEKSVLAPRMSAARISRHNAPLRAAAAPAVGDLMQLNVAEGCNNTTPRFRTGRVAAISNRAIVVADTGNPSGGYTDADYQSFGVTFDTLIAGVDEAAFGAPSDIDANGRVIIFYTRAVNELTPAGSTAITEG